MMKDLEDERGLAMQISVFCVFVGIFNCNFWKNNNDDNIPSRGKKISGLNTVCNGAKCSEFQNCFSHPFDYFSH